MVHAQSTNFGYRGLFPMVGCTMSLPHQESDGCILKSWEAPRSPVKRDARSFPVPTHVPDREYRPPDRRYPAFPIRYPAQNNHGVTESTTWKSLECAPESSQEFEAKLLQEYPPIDSWCHLRA